MSAYALVRIKNGSRCDQDHRSYRWPPSQYENGNNFAGVPDDCVFVAEKRLMGKGKVYWNCVADGAGMFTSDGGNYGNGSISADDVEMMTPMLGYKPELPK